MRSISEILNEVVDGVITSREDADALLAHESGEYARARGVTEDEARHQLRKNLEYAAALCPARHAGNLRKWFDLEES